MPSLKMKTKPTIDSLKEKSGLHICRRSSMISKGPLSRAVVCQNAEVCTLHTQDAVVFDEARVVDHGGDEALHDESCSEEIFSHKRPSTLTDSITVENVEPTSSTCTSNIETIFSPVLESMDIYNNQGTDNLNVQQLNTEDSDDGSRTSSEYQGCNVSDFHVSDMMFFGPSIGSSSEYDDTIDTTFLPDYKCEESDLLCDLTEECMMLPLLEDSLDSRCELGDRPSQENDIAANCSSLYMAIHQLRSQSHNQDSHQNILSDQDYECFDPQMYIRNLPDQIDMSFTPSPTPVPNAKQITKSITLVLDLDETLVHSTLDQCDDADFTFPVFFDMKEHAVYVRKRPHLQTFLNRVAEMFEVVVFTASQSIYAGQLLDILDPDGKVISRRAYRESCIFSEGAYVKDLTVLGVDLAKVVIIDNSPQVFRLQVNNGIPIKSWFDDPSDSALISLLPFLESLVDADDVRPIIARKFGNKE